MENFGLRCGVNKDVNINFLKGMTQRRIKAPLNNSNTSRLEAIPDRTLFVLFCLLGSNFFFFKY